MLNKDITIVLRRIHYDDITKYSNIILRNNAFITIKMPDGKYKIVCGDGLTSLSNLPLQDTLSYDPNQIYYSGRLIIKSHNENE